VNITLGCPTLITMYNYYTSATTMQNANEIYNVKENCKAEVKNKPIPIVMI